MTAESLHLVTGAPGTGKSAVLNRLPGDWTVVAEPARLVLAELRLRGASPQDLPLDDFVELILGRSIEQYDGMEPGARALFDRGIPDSAAYAIYFGVDPEACLAAARHRRYHDTALLFEPWEEIYTTDEERTMTFDMTVSFHDAIRNAYALAGYRFEVVPKASIDDRACFIADFVGA